MVKEILGQPGFSKPEDLPSFVQAQKDTEVAQFTEVKQREQAAAERAAGLSVGKLRRLLASVRPNSSGPGRAWRAG